MSDESIFIGFSPTPRATLSAPAGGPARAASPPVAPSASSRAPDAAESAVAFASAAPSERSRCVDGVSGDARTVLARFSGAAVAGPSGAGVSRAMATLMSRDRATSSALVAELRQDAARMKRRESSGAAAAAVAAASPPDDESSAGPLAGAPVDASACGRFAALAERSAEMQAAMERGSAAGANPSVTAEATQPPPERDVQPAAATYSSTTLDQATSLTASSCPAKPEAGADTAEVEARAPRVARPRVTFSHLAAGTPRLPRDAAVALLQRQFRRYAAAAAAQRLVALLHLVDRVRQHRDNDGASAVEAVLHPVACPFGAGSVTSCPTTARWLRHSAAPDAVRDVVVSCRTGVCDLPYPARCIAAAALEYEVRLHGENLSRFLLAASERGGGRRGTANVPRRGGRDGGDVDGGGGHDSEDDQDHPGAGRISRCVRKALLNASDADEVVDMLRTALSAAGCSTARLGAVATNDDEGEGSGGDGDDEAVAASNESGGDSSVMRLAAQWVADSLAPFRRASLCHLLGGAAAHGASEALLASRCATLEGTPLVRCDCGDDGAAMVRAAEAGWWERRYGVSAVDSAVTNGALMKLAENYRNLVAAAQGVVSEQGKDAAATAATAVSSERRVTASRPSRIFYVSVAPHVNDENANGGAQPTRSAKSGSDAEKAPADWTRYKLPLSDGPRAPDSDAFSSSVASPSSVSSSTAATTTTAVGEIALRPNTPPSPSPSPPPPPGDAALEPFLVSPPLSEDERALIAQLGAVDADFATAMAHIDAADEFDAAQADAETGRRLAAATAVQERAADAMREFQRAARDVSDDGFADASVALSVVLVRSSRKVPQVARDAAETGTAAAVPTAGAGHAQARVCVVCELDESGTRECGCGNFFHVECGVRVGTADDVFACCAFCKSNAAATAK